MLNCLVIDDFALIEHSEIEFEPGFNVITGESGAGKSIMMGALALLLGDRADRGAIRTGADRATVSAVFTVPAGQREEIAALFDEAGLPFDRENGEITLRRVLGASATRNFVNDVPVGAKLLARLGEELVDRHGAGEQLSLTSPARQLALLDRYAATETEAARCAECARRLAELERERRDFEAGLPSGDDLERLRLLVEEVDRENPEPNEDEELEARQKLGANAREVLQTSSELAACLTESEDSLADRLGEVHRRLRDLGRIDDRTAAPLLEECEKLQEALSAFSLRISGLADHVELDGEALAAIEARLGVLYTLKRRYGPSLEQVLAARDQATQRVRDFDRAAARREEFARRADELRRELADAAQVLSRKRRAAADRFTGEIRGVLTQLGFADSRFAAEFQEIAPGANGMDRFELLFSANPGEEMRPLRRIASSGELSRLMLAMKTCLADADSVPTVIFDEIDMNIGGETANRVGDELRRLGESRQIISISHLAQVAVRASTHWLVEKHTARGRTVSTVRRLDDRAPELARMLGGGGEALTHARALLAAAAPESSKGKSKSLPKRKK